MNSGFQIMVDHKYGVPKNFFVIDRFFFGDVNPPPKHFKYVRKNRAKVSYFTLSIHSLSIHSLNK